MRELFITLALWLLSQTAVASPNIMICNSRQSAFICLVCNCYHETRGEPREGMIAVAKTVLSRKEDNMFPDTTCGVIFQTSQFSWTSDRYANKINASKPEDKQALQRCREAVDRSLNEGPNGLLFYYNPRRVTPVWARHMTACGRVGEHAFLVPRGEKCPATLGSNRKSSAGHQQRLSNKGTTK